MRNQKIILSLGILSSCWILQSAAADLNIKEDTVPPAPEEALMVQSIIPLMATPAQNPRPAVEKPAEK